MKPTILIDMNLSPEWVTTFLAGGWPAVHWSSIGAADAPDGSLMEWAQHRGAVVFTHDLDFGTALALSRANRPSVFQMRGRRVLPEQAGDLVLALLERYRPELEAGALVVVDEHKSRVRILPLG